MTTQIALPAGATPHDYGLAHAMDPQWVKSAIESAQLHDAELLALKGNYVRFKGQHGSLVGWRARTRDADGEHDTHVTVRCIEPARLQLEARRLQGRADVVHAGLRGLARVADDTMLLAFPMDRTLRDLRNAIRASRLRTVVTDHAAHWLPRGTRVSKHRSSAHLVRFKPERRAVLRWQLGLVGDEATAEQSVYIRIHAADTGSRAAAAMRIAGDYGVRCPEAIPIHERYVLEKALAGAPESAPLSEAQAADTGAMLARLHSTPVPGEMAERGPLDELDATLRSARDLAALAPSLGRRAEVLGKRLSRWVPVQEHDCLLHGDFHQGQLLFDGHSGVGFVDFDRVVHGDPAYDIAAFRAHDALRGTEQSADLRDALVTAYAGEAPRPEHRKMLWYEASALTRLAMQPFRQLDPEWPTAAERLLELADARADEARL